MLIRFDPFRDFDPFRELDRRTSGRPGRVPTLVMDAVRRDGEVELRFDLPGFAADQIDVEVERNVLTVTAERSWERKEGEEVLVAERGHGRVSRQIALGDNVDTEALEANYADGVLTVTLPVTDAAKARKVAVGVGPRSLEVESGEAEPSDN